MNNTAHTPEPWQVVIQPSKTWVGMRSVHICAAGDPSKVMSVAHIGDISGTNPDEEANAARIVACVNACQGLADPAEAINAAKASCLNGLRRLSALLDHATLPDAARKSIDLALQDAGSALDTLCGPEGRPAFSRGR